MKSERELQSIVRSWLEDGVNVLPDRVLDDVLAQVPMTPQRRVTWWPARRVIDMSNFAGLAKLAAAVMVLVVAGGIGLALLRSPGVGGPEPTPTPSPTTEPSPT